MRKWLIALAALVVILGGLFWYFMLDGAAPAEAPGEFQLEAYRALVESDAPETLPTDVRIEFVGQSQAPSFAAEAGDFSGERTFTYTAFQIVAPGGDTIVDGAVDQQTVNQMTDGEGTFDPLAHQRVLDAMTRAQNVLITHEHLDHVMAVARHPEPAAIAARLRLTQPQIAGLPEHAPNGVLAPEIAAATPHDFSAPQRIAPGIVAHAAPGHTAGTIVLYVRTAAREYLLIGDIAWLMSTIEHARGRPRLIRVFLPGVDPDRPAVLRQVRALHDLHAAEPDLVILPAHDADYLRGLVSNGALVEGFGETPAPAPAPAP